MADRLRGGAGLLLCLIWAGCHTPEFYHPIAAPVEPPPLTVIRPDAPPTDQVTRSATLDTRQLPQANSAEVVPASATRVEPVSSVPQRLPDMVAQPTPRPELDPIRGLIQQAQFRLAGMDSYYIRFRRREVIHGRPMPEDLLMCSFRQQPFSVYMKSIGPGPHEGREVIFVAGKYQNMMQVRTGKGDVISGICLELDPHSARATANSRRTIDEAGLGNLLQRIAAVLQRVESGQGQEILTYLGAQQRPESRLPMEAFAQKLPPGQEKLLPQGGRRTFYFNTDTQSAEYQLPVLVITEDAAGREVEYYYYDRLSANVGLMDRDFDPGILWGKR